MREKTNDPMTIAMGNASDMEKAIATLNQVKESIINAYVGKSGISRKKVAQLMSDETWMNEKMYEVLYEVTIDLQYEDETSEDEQRSDEPEGEVTE